MKEELTKEDEELTKEDKDWNWIKKDKLVKDCIKKCGEYPIARVYLLTKTKQKQKIEKIRDNLIQRFRNWKKLYKDKSTNNLDITENEAEQIIREEFPKEVKS